MTTVTFDDQQVDQPPPQSKQAIVGTLPVVEALIREYINHLAPRDRLQVQLSMSAFLIWARKRYETAEDDNVLTFRIEKGVGDDTND
jgi:hypothetical protein